MTHLRCAQFIVFMLFIGSSLLPSAAAGMKSPSGPSFFASASVGGNTIAYESPGGIGFSEFYGSSTAISYGGEVGLGSAKSGIYGMARFRRWQKSGTPLLTGDLSSSDIELTWIQQTISLGARYHVMRALSPTSRFLPYFGAGLMLAEITENQQGTVFAGPQPVPIDITTELTGTGFYLEGGIMWLTEANIGIGGVIEYSTLSVDADEFFESVTASGLYVGVTVHAFFGAKLP